MVKRIFDILFACIVLILTAPLFFFITIVIKIYSPGPLLYKGRRVGQYGKIFYIFKFRTMVVNAEKLGGSATAGDDSRITRVGHILRKYKLDELPQFINIARGEMSFVGPRPDVEKILALYSQEEKVILNLVPGITDYATLWDFNEGEVLRGSLNPEEMYIREILPIKKQLQLKYMRERSFFVDLKIICLTIRKLFSF